MRWFDRTGMQISMWRANELGADWSYVRVARTTLAPAADPEALIGVSTVWLGLDHGWGFGPRLIFETMVFNGDLDESQCRYATEAEARAGHDAVVARVAATLTDPVITHVELPAPPATPE